MPVNIAAASDQCVAFCQIAQPFDHPTDDSRSKPTVPDGVAIADKKPHHGGDIVAIPLILHEGFPETNVAVKNDTRKKTVVIDL